MYLDLCAYASYMRWGDGGVRDEWEWEKMGKLERLIGMSWKSAKIMTVRIKSTKMK